mmetsp:Transcript_13785/g.18406  ORF Transcript_13785/g.18406 Transcript_13785/m.18406 type:complete len:393 (-) Transcript_13785:1639-2817(-)|eukprot:CAMPEP_0197285526 /NCGR_PEP_ID=MMETSP0890-20130614/849_1 /TAXON_ID=44058 ORGANISM="Aureoumbra lagunensis, Strain CCMP1510" /NCGR_SAMPLE_ID=MMETSP0890 /ASSEMBLY_ACC=CAM_ASM_000533 /LENGTH=392 /DNA_ID=CAMNT_0042753131 /DNA_START=133 /DNA_END=1311 /DNA_ORIENTATION=+
MACLFQCNDINKKVVDESKEKEEDEGLMAWWNNLVRSSGLSEENKEYLERIVSTAEDEEEAVDAICQIVDSVDNEESLLQPDEENEEKESDEENQEEETTISQENNSTESKKESDEERTIHNSKESLVTAALMLVTYLKSKDKKKNIVLEEEIPEWLLPEDRAAAAELAYPEEKRVKTVSPSSLRRNMMLMMTKKKKTNDVDLLWRWQFLAQMMPVSNTTAELKLFFQRRLKALASRGNEILAANDQNCNLLWIAVSKNDEFAVIHIIDMIAAMWPPDTFLQWLSLRDNIRQLNALELAQSLNLDKVAGIITAKKSYIESIVAERNRPISHDIGESLSNYEFAKAHNPLFAWVTQKLSAQNNKKAPATFNKKQPRIRKTSPLRPVLSSLPVH